mmetsp:Transcript_17933/g.33719  ORF Transcript_17933/g.33719 Transcript_17933/m.33719 type:complete len:371 (-) Transcript_17933:279-1391(-)
MSDFSTPSFSFGIIGDPQYCDADDGSNYAKTVIRRYRQSFDILKEAVSVFESHGTHCNVVLGDTIDGKAKSLGKHYECIQDIKSVTGDNCHYVLGNHDYYNFNRSELKELLIPASHQDICSADQLYYSFTPTLGHRFIILDGYDHSIIGASTEQIALASDHLVREKNHNYRAGSNDWFVGIPLEHYRYVPYNGGLGDDQLAWLERTLDESREAQELCYIFCHQPIHAKASREANLLWNAEAVLNLLHRESNCHVVAFFSGHDHDGGYTCDTMGIHHLVPPAPLECDVGEVAYGVFDVHGDHMHLHWSGKLPPLCVGREGSEVVNELDVDMERLQSTENQVSVHRGSDTAPFLAVSTPCIWPAKLKFRIQK